MRLSNQKVSATKLWWIRDSPAALFRPNRSLKTNIKLVSQSSAYLCSYP